MTSKYVSFSRGCFYCSLPLQCRRFCLDIISLVSEDNLWQPFLSIIVGSEVWTQVTRLVSNHRHSLNHLTIAGSYSKQIMARDFIMEFSHDVFLWTLCDTPSCVFTIFYFPFTFWKSYWLPLSLGSQKHLCKGFCIYTNFCLIWVKTEYNCWVTHQTYI